MSKWTIKLEQDPETGDLIMPLTDEMLHQVGWGIGDTLIWEQNSDNSWSLRKVQDESSQNATE